MNLQNINNRFETIKPYIAWFIAASFVFFQLFIQTASTIMSEYWARDFHLNEVQLSNLSAAFFYSYIPMQIPAGILYDKFETKTILFLSAVLLSISSILFAFTFNYTLALIFRFFMGLGAASGFVGLLKIIDNKFSPDRFVLMFGLAEAMGMGGVAVGVVALAAFLKDFTWRHTMLISGIYAGILGFLILFFIKPDSKPNKTVSFSIKQLALDMKSIVLNKQIILCSIYGFFIVSIMNCFTSLWGDAFMTYTYNLNAHTISLLISTIFVGLAIGSPCNGWFVKKYGKHRELMLWEAGLSTLVTAAIILIPNVPIAGLFMLFFSIGFLCSGYGPCYALVNEAVGPEIRATAVATANMLIVSSAPVLQLIVGGILKSQFFGIASTASMNYRMALTILPIGYLISFISGFFIKPSKLVNANLNQSPAK